MDCEVGIKQETDADCDGSVPITQAVDNFKELATVKEEPEEDPGCGGSQSNVDEDETGDDNDFNPASSGEEWTEEKETAIPTKKQKLCKTSKSGKSAPNRKGRKKSATKRKYKYSSKVQEAQEELLVPRLVASKEDFSEYLEKSVRHIISVAHRENKEPKAFHRFYLVVHKIIQAGLEQGHVNMDEVDQVWINCDKLADEPSPPDALPVVKRIGSEYIKRYEKKRNMAPEDQTSLALNCRRLKNVVKDYVVHSMETNKGVNVIKNDLKTRREFFQQLVHLPLADDLDETPISINNLWKWLLQEKNEKWEKVLKQKEERLEKRRIRHDPENIRMRRYMYYQYYKTTITPEEKARREKRNSEYRKRRYRNMPEEKKEQRKAMVRNWARKLTPERKREHIDRIRQWQKRKKERLKLMKENGGVAPVDFTLPAPPSNNMQSNIPYHSSTADTIPAAAPQAAVSQMDSQLPVMGDMGVDMRLKRLIPSLDHSAVPQPTCSSVSETTFDYQWNFQQSYPQIPLQPVDPHATIQSFPSYNPINSNPSPTTSPNNYLPHNTNEHVENSSVNDDSEDRAWFDDGDEPASPCTPSPMLETDTVGGDIVERKLFADQVNVNNLHNDSPNKTESQSILELDLPAAAQSETEPYPQTQHEISTLALSEMCDECGKQFVSEKRLNHHKKEMHGPNRTKQCCPKCDLTFSRSRTLWHHIISSHASEKGTEAVKRLLAQAKGQEMAQKSSRNPQLVKIASFVCDQCGNHFANAKSLKRHVFYIHGEGSTGEVKFQCSHCDKVFKQRSSMVEHVRKVHKGVEFRCEICNRDCQSPGKLWKHKVQTHGLTDCPAPAHLVQCQYCGESVLNGYTNHVKANHPEYLETYLSSLIPKPRKRTPTTNVDEKPERRIQCAYCSKLLNRKSIQRHMRNVHRLGDAKSFSCSECGKVFKEMGYLEKHVRLVHTLNFDKLVDERGLLKVAYVYDESGNSTKTLECSICNYKLSERMDFKIHLVDKHHDVFQEITSSEVNMECEVCKEQFPRMKDMREHLTSVHGDLTWNCPECLKFISTQQAMKTHLRTHPQLQSKTTEPIKDKSCRKCDGKFSCEADLWKHVEDIHPGTAVYCKYCRKPKWNKRLVYVHYKHCNLKPKATYSWDDVKVVCEICKHSLLKSSLRRHMIAVHRLEELPCTEPGCSASFKRKDHLSLHLTSQHGIKKQRIAKSKSSDKRIAAENEDSECNNDDNMYKKQKSHKINPRGKKKSADRKRHSTRLKEKQEHLCDSQMQTFHETNALKRAFVKLVRLTEDEIRSYSKPSLN